MTSPCSPSGNSIWLRTSHAIPGPAPPKGPVIEHEKKIGLWAVRLPSADPIVVRKTLSALAQNPHGLPGVNESPEQIKKRERFWSTTVKPAHFGVKLGAKSLLGVLRFITIGMIIGIFIMLTRRCVLLYPSFFAPNYLIFNKFYFLNYLRIFTDVSLHDHSIRRRFVVCHRPLRDP